MAFQNGVVLCLFVVAVSSAPLGQSGSGASVPPAESGKPRPTAEQEALIKESFQELDVNGDNKVSLEEILPIAVKVSETGLDKTLRKLDSNGDGVVSAREFFIPSNTINQQLFFNVDLNRDGQLELDSEIKQFLSSQFSKIFTDSLDENSDGGLSVQEYEDFYMSQIALESAAQQKEAPQQ